ncbi:Signal recognition particle, SRP9/SRP14 subunit [Mycena kentingensis (nom. inval.)]|nr:Signal recognition particle, SRP9/SRP14 subunit [Mycena kentingensis (nom. inval.)]
MELLDHDSFLQRLQEMFESSKEHGSVWLTHKRLTREDEDVAMQHESTEDGTDEREYPCLIRATDGEKKVSTRVTSSELAKFHAAYGALLKATVTPSLRKRDKKKEKQKAEQAAKRKKRMTEPVVVEGPKRGNGRRKRVRREKALRKQVEAGERFREREAAAAERAAAV